MSDKSDSVWREVKEALRTYSEKYPHRGWEVSREAVQVSRGARVTEIAHGYTALANLYAVPFTAQAQKALEDCFDTDVFYRLRFWLVSPCGRTVHT